jgi:hypothetical protein
MMATAAGIGLFFVSSGFQGFQGTQKSEGMAEYGSGFYTPIDSGHVTADTVGKCVDGMGVSVFNHGMARQTLLRPGFFGLKLSRRYPQLMDVMARRTGNALLSMDGLLPVLVLLVMTVGDLIAVNALNGSVREANRGKVRP